MKSAFAREFEREGPGREQEAREGAGGRERSCNKHPASFFLLLRNFVLNPLLVNCIRTDGDLFSFVDVSA